MLTRSGNGVKLLLFLLAVVTEEVLVRSWDWWWEWRGLIEQAAKPGDPHQPGIAFEAPETPPPPPIPIPNVVPAKYPSTPPPPPPPPDWVLKPGEDFDIFVLSQEYRWELRTTKILRPGGTPEELAGKLDGLLEQYGRNYQDLIAVGTASCEGRDWRESKRAGDRSYELVRLLRDADKSKRLYRLNLGRFKTCGGSSTEETGDQRRVILIAVKRSRQDMGLGELRRALWDELDDPGRLPLGFRMDKYSEFDFKEAR